MLVKHQLKTVVIGCVDSNKLVAGKGIERLKNAGINVIVGVLEDECKAHHKRFFTFQNKKRPYIVLKWAETKDGFLAPLIRKEQAPVWISNKFSQQLVHKFRSEEHAILVGTNTVIADNSKLNVRSWFGNNPVRIVLDKNLRIPTTANVFDGSVKTVVLIDAANKQQETRPNIILEAIDFASKVAEQIVAILYKHQIQSVIVEGGLQTLQTFIDANLWDETIVFVGQNSFKEGIKAPILTAKIASEKNIKNDILKTYYND